MTEKLTWNAHLHCFVAIVHDTTMRVPRILNEGGCMRPPHRLLVLNKMFGYDTFEVICRRKYKTIEVVDILQTGTMAELVKNLYSVINENRKIFSTLGLRNGKYWSAGP